MDTPQASPQHAGNSLPQSCGTCANWTRHTDERMAEHGVCALRDVWYYTHRYTECVFDPCRWGPKREVRP